MSFDIYMSHRRYGPDMKVRLADTQTDRYHDSMGEVSKSELTIDNKPCTICYRQEKCTLYIYSLDSESDVLCLNR